MPLLQVRECPEDIYRKITYAAKNENRTIAQQIIVLLEKAFKHIDEAPDWKAKGFKFIENAIENLYE